MDIYSESRKLADALSNYKEDSISQEILDTINYSSTGTEIVMKLRFYLNELLRNNFYDDTEIAGLAKKILTEINQIMN
jgi:hypothetical protein